MPTRSINTSSRLSSVGNIGYFIYIKKATATFKICKRSEIRSKDYCNATHWFVRTYHSFSSERRLHLRTAFGSDMLKLGDNFFSRSVDAKNATSGSVIGFERARQRCAVWILVDLDSSRNDTIGHFFLLHLRCICFEHFARDFERGNAVIRDIAFSFDKRSGFLLTPSC